MLIGEFTKITGREKRLIQTIVLKYLLPQEWERLKILYGGSLINFIDIIEKNEKKALENLKKAQEEREKEFLTNLIL